jgi:hypothetical protein
LILFGKEPDVTGTLHDRYPRKNGIAAAECLAQIERLVNSPLLQGSEALTKLLRYLARHTLSVPATHLKEYQIATEVLGRQSDFDPQTDSSVRVQVGRLRAKLAEHFGADYCDDPILVGVPKGGYALSFERRVASTEREPAAKAVAHSPTASSAAKTRRMAIFGAGILMCLLAMAGVETYLWRQRTGWPLVEGRENPKLPIGIETFWTPFALDKDAPIVVVSNAAFVGDPKIGMHYYDPYRDSREQVSQHYTGVGEMMGIVKLDRLFNRFEREFRVKRSALFTLDDALNNNLIFLGSPMQNPLLDKVHKTSEFVIQVLPEEKHPWASVVNLHPRNGEQRIYRAEPRLPSQVSEDYAIIALVPGLDPSKRTLILEGISTLGTQAAVDFVCDEGSLEEIMRQLNVKSGAPVPHFEALLLIKVANDVPIATQLIAVHETAR